MLLSPVPIQSTQQTFMKDYTFAVTVGVSFQGKLRVTHEVLQFCVWQQQVVKGTRKNIEKNVN